LRDRPRRQPHTIRADSSSAIPVWRRNGRTPPLRSEPHRTLTDRAPEVLGIVVLLAYVPTLLRRWSGQRVLHHRDRAVGNRLCDGLLLPPDDV